jgi:hypothetical protein
MILLFLSVLLWGADTSWVPSGTVATPLSIGSAKNLEMYVLTMSPGNSDDQKSSGVLRINGQTLTGPQAFLKAREGVVNPADLAMLSMCFLENGVAGRSPWSGQAVGEQREVGVAPPTLDGNILVYWRLQGQTADLVRVRVNLDTTNVLSMESERDLGRKDPFGTAQKLLADPNDFDRCDEAIDLLIESKDPRGYPILLDQALHAVAPAVRENAVDGLILLKVPGAVDVLTKVLLEDPVDTVRYHVAAQLIQNPNPEMRDALEKATKDVDPNVGDMARSALTRLPARWTPFMGCGG